MRIPTRCATTHRSRTLHSSRTQTQNCLLDPQVAHCPLLIRLTSTIHYRQVKKMPISFRHSTSHAPHTLLDLLPSLQTQAMSARLLKRFPPFPLSFPPHNLRSFSCTHATSSTSSLSLRAKAADQVAQPTQPVVVNTDNILTHAIILLINPSAALTFYLV